MTCNNCGADAEGNFCSNCAQPLRVKRITFKEAWRDFGARIYGFDGMFPRTFKDLTIRPGLASREFIEGNRARYYGPVGYYFLMITCFLLWHQIIGLDYVDYLRSMQESLPTQNGSDKVNLMVRGFVADNLKLIAFVTIPFSVFAARYIFFRKQGLNFLEHSVPIFYMMGHLYWFQIFESTLFRFTGISTGTTMQAVASSLYLGFGYTSFVTTQPKWKTFLKGLGVYVLGFTLMFVTIMIITLGVVFILAAVDPKTLDMFKPSKVH
jgi:hypothetical protein